MSTVELSTSERNIVIGALRYTARRFILGSRSRTLAGPFYKDMRASYRKSAHDYNALADRIEKTAP